MNKKELIITYALLVVLAVLSWRLGSYIVDRVREEEKPICYHEQFYATSYSSVTGDTLWKKVIKVDCPEKLKVYD